VVGLVLNTIVIFYGYTAFAIPVLFLWGDWDPFQLVLIILSSPHAPFGLPDLTMSVWGKVVRAILTSLLLHVMMVNIRTFSVLALGYVLNYIKLLKRIYSLELNPRIITEFNQLYINMNMMDKPTKIVASIVLQALFTCIVFGTNVFIIGFKLGSFAMCFFAAMITSLGVFGSSLVFMIGCSWYEISEAVLNSWRWQIVDKPNRQWYKRKVRSCRRMVLTAGGIGILDDTIRNTFHHSALIYTANLLIATPQILT